MKTIRYKVLPGVGFSFFYPSKKGTVLDLLADIPYFLPSKLVPPLVVVNSVLAQGKDDAGMSGGCKWKPFQLTQAEYDEMVAEMKRLGFVELQAPDWVVDSRTFGIWHGEVVYGIPSEKIRPLLDEIFRLEKIKGKERDSNRLNALWKEYGDVCNLYRTEPKIANFERK